MKTKIKPKKQKENKVQIKSFNKMKTKIKMRTKIKMKAKIKLKRDEQHTKLKGRKRFYKPHIFLQINASVYKKCMCKFDFLHNNKIIIFQKLWFK